ncbi:hypothetical protein D3C72_1809040 [compost metagenome]
MDNFADFGYGKPDPPAAQDFLQQMPVGGTIEARAATTLRMEQTLVFVEAKRAGRHSKFARQFSYTVILLHNRSDSLGKRYNIDFYV